MSNIEQIKLNTLVKWVNVRIAPSEIHGVGVFAIRDILKGEKLYMDIMPELFNLPYKKIKNNLPEYISEILLERWPLIKDGSPFIYPDARYVAYCNHSDEANYSAKDDVALRDIKVGEEITENYKEIEGWKEVFTFLKD